MSRYIVKRDRREKLVASTSELQRILNLYIERDTRLEDAILSKELGMNLRTFKRRKNQLVNEGLLEVRKIGARTYEIALGKLAIAKRDKVFEKVDIAKMAYKLFGKDEELMEEYYTSFVPSLSPEDAAKWEETIKKYPMPTEQDIINIL